MIGSHVVAYIPDPDVQAWGPVLNSNAFFTNDIAGWKESPFSPAWAWFKQGTNGYAVQSSAAGSRLTRDDVTGAIPRGGATLFRVRQTVTVSGAGWIVTGIGYGDTALAAAEGPFWAGTGHAANFETAFHAAAPGTYSLEFTHDPASVPGAFIFVNPYGQYDPGQTPWVDSMELHGQGAEVIDITCLVDAVTIHHGRDDASGQPDAPSCTIDMSLDTGEEEYPASLDVGGIIRVTTETVETITTRFAGRVTDITQGWDEAGPETPDRAIISVIATGSLSELGRRIVGDAPWPQELDGARVSRVMAAAGVTLNPNTSDPGTVQILARDVDSQSALDVAQAVAESAGGLVWATRDGDIRYADADHRRGTTWGLQLDACDILVTPYWSRTSGGLINRVSIGYGVTPEGQDQPRYVAQRDDSIAMFGRYEYTTTTELVALADASAIGQLLLTRNRVPVWIMASLPVDVAGLSVADTTQLLNLDMHDLINLTGLPAAGEAPTSALLWVEGWTETLTFGGHEIELVVSGFCRTAPAPRWNDLAASITWNSMGQLTWDDATCLGPQPSQGRWDDVSASARWNQVAFNITWDTWPG